MQLWEVMIGLDEDASKIAQRAWSKEQSWLVQSLPKVTAAP